MCKTEIITTRPLDLFNLIVFCAMNNVLTVRMSRSSLPTVLISHRATTKQPTDEVLPPASVVNCFRCPSVAFCGSGIRNLTMTSTSLVSVIQFRWLAIQFLALTLSTIGVVAGHLPRQGSYPFLFTSFL